MNRRISCLVITIGVVFTSVCSPAFAKKAKPGTPGSEMQLVSIDLNNNKLTVCDPAGKNISTLAVTQVTTVTVNGQPAKLSDLRPNMHVLLSVSHGGKTADKIDATSLPNKKSN